LAARRELRAVLRRSVNWPEAPADCVAVSRPSRDGRTFTAVLNTAQSARDVQLPSSGGDVLLCSAGRPELAGGALTVPAESTVWVIG
jgi:hypothetical protein